MKHDALVKTFWEVGGCNDNHALALLKPIHFHEKLVEGLLHILLVASIAFTANSIQFIDKYNCRLFFASSSEQIPYPLGANANEHLFEVGPLSVEECQKGVQ
jgi:hypothetical protein